MPSHVGHRTAALLAFAYSQYMLAGATSFNQSLHEWDVGHKQHMSMFKGATDFCKGAKRDTSMYPQGCGGTCGCKE